MQIDIDYYTTDSSPGKNFFLICLEYIEAEHKGSTAVVRLFGINVKGNSVCAHVHNFKSYFYVEVDTKIYDVLPEDCGAI